MSNDHDVMTGAAFGIDGGQQLLDVAKRDGLKEQAGAGATPRRLCAAAAHPGGRRRRREEAAGVRG